MMRVVTVGEGARDLLITEQNTLVQTQPREYKPITVGLPDEKGNKNSQGWKFNSPSKFGRSSKTTMKFLQLILMIQIFRYSKFEFVTF